MMSKQFQNWRLLHLKAKILYQNDSKQAQTSPAIYRLNVQEKL